MANNRNQYIYGAAVPKFDYHSEFEQKSVSLKNKKNNDKNNNIKIKIKMVSAIILVFMMCMAIMYRYTLITELNYNIETYNAKYQEIRNENSMIRIKIEQGTDLPKIKELAEKNLNMQKPNKQQIIYVNVGKTDFTKVSKESDNSNETNGNLFAGAYKKITGIVNLFY